jgi:DeoR/GlpR family transcriptional regulator of sugar metabolism
VEPEPLVRADNERNTQERRWAIVQEVQRRQRATVAELSQSLGVSEVSIRRDLEHLDGAGLLHRVRGGAEATSHPAFASLFEARLLQNRESKQALGAAAAGLIGAGDSILLDAGTTMLEVARQIPDSLLDGGGLTILTRSLVIAGELRRHRRTRLILLGGLYIHDFDAFVGPHVERLLAEVHVRWLFVGTDGITLERGMATDNLPEMGLYRLMARCADRVVLVADSSKIGVNKLQQILSIEDLHVLVTDSGAPADFVAALRQRNIEVLLVPGCPGERPVPLATSGKGG